MRPKVGDTVRLDTAFDRRLGQDRFRIRLLGTVTEANDSTDRYVVRWDTGQVLDHSHYHIGLDTRGEEE